MGRTLRQVAPYFKMNIILIILAVVCSLLAAAIPVQGTDVWFSQFIAVSIFGFLFVALKISEFSKPLAIFYTYCIFSTVFIAQYNTLSLMMLMMTGLCGLIAAETAKLEEVQRKALLKVFLFILIFQIGWGIVQKLNLDPIFKLATDKHFCDTVGFSGSHNQYSLFISALSPLVFDNLFGLLFVLGGLILSTSFAGFVGLAFAYAFYYRKNILAKVFGCALLVLFILAFNFMNHKDLVGKFNERFDLWKLSSEQVFTGKAVMQIQDNIKKIKTCNPLFGFGFGEFFQVSPYTQSEVIAKNSHGAHRYEHAHNDYIEILFDLGIAGVLLFGFFIFSLVKQIRSVVIDKELNIIICCLIAVGGCALSVYTLHTAYNGMLIAVIIGLLHGKINSLPRRT